MNTVAYVAIGPNKKTTFPATATPLSGVCSWVLNVEKGGLLLQIAHFFAWDKHGINPGQWVRYLHLCDRQGKILRSYRLKEPKRISIADSVSIEHTIRESK